MEASPSNTPTAKPAIGAIITGLFVAALSFLAATAQGMTTAPSAWAGMVATAGIVFGLAMTLMGIASIWLSRFRRPARISNYVVLSALVLVFLADKVLIFIG